MGTEEGGGREHESTVWGAQSHCIDRRHGRILLGGIMTLKPLPTEQQRLPTHYTRCNANANNANSPEGHIIATGGGDGKVKLWNASSGFCIVTFDQHQGGHMSVVAYLLCGCMADKQEGERERERMG